jgi:DNA-binding MarR family transcriptional regulator
VRCIRIYRERVPSHSLLYFETFMLIAARGLMVPGEIARTLEVPQAMITGALDCLGTGPNYPEKYGKPPKIVDRINHPTDGRAKLAVLSAKGSQLVAEMRAALAFRSHQ